MMEWKEVTIQQITSILGDGLHGTPQYDDKGDYYFVNGNNLVCGHIEIKSDTKSVNRSEYEKYKKDLNSRTLLVSINGTIGNVAKYNGEKCILGKSACYFNVNEDVDRDFIYYVVSSPSFIRNINNQATGTTIKNVSLKQMREYRFHLPQNISDQRRIASILSSLDRKIELNNKINAQLEEMAQAIFKSWFVNFEPFKDGKFVESELGMIPEGWRVGTLGELIEIKYGKDHKILQDGHYPLYGSGGIMRKVEKYLYRGESVLIPRKGTLNNIMYVKEPFWTVDTMFYSAPRVEKIMLYVYNYIKRFDFEKMNEGTSIPSTTTARLNGLSILIPSYNSLSKYNEVVSSLYAKIHQNIKENSHLSQLRDTLLPKLINGEIELPEEDEFYYCNYYKGEEKCPFPNGSLAASYWEDEIRFFLDKKNQQIGAGLLKNCGLEFIPLSKDKLLAMPQKTREMLAYAVGCAVNMCPMGGDDYLKHYGKSVEELENIEK